MLDGTDNAAFDELMRDLALAFDRPHDVERVRVFWEALKHVSIHEVKRLAKSHAKHGKRFPAPRDLMPERAAAPPPKQQDDAPKLSQWAIAANEILFSVAYRNAGGRGFSPIGIYQPMPEGGYGLPLRVQHAPDGSALDRVLAAKRDLVGAAEADERHGQPWDRLEFNRACREAFQKLLGEPEREARVA